MGDNTSTDGTYPLATQVAPRIEPASIDEVDERTRGILDMTKGLNGEGVLNVFGVMAHHPRALNHGIALGGAFMYRSTIGDRMREIVIIRVAKNTRCEYEYAQHLVIGQRCGMSASECQAVLRDDIGEGFTDLERTVVAAVDSLCADDVVGDTEWSRLAEEWDEQQLVELVMLAGYYRMLAGFLNSAGVQIDAGLTGFPEND